MPLKLQPLTVQAFAPFGNVLQKTAAVWQEINQGHTRKYADLAQVDTADAGGRPAVHIYNSRPVSLPLRIETLERHPLGSQAFIPLHPRPFLIVVAPAGPAPQASQVRGFFSNGQQGVNYHKGVWHHYQITLHETSDYLVIDRAGPGENFEEYRLAQTLVIGEFAS
jgi:ureidoglycolate lyase